MAIIQPYSKSFRTNSVAYCANLALMTAAIAGPIGACAVQLTENTEDDLPDTAEKNQCQTVCLPSTLCKSAWVDWSEVRNDGSRHPSADIRVRYHILSVSRAVFDERPVGFAVLIEAGRKPPGAGGRSAPSSVGFWAAVLPHPHKRRRDTNRRLTRDHLIRADALDAYSMSNFVLSETQLPDRVRGFEVTHHARVANSAGGVRTYLEGSAAFECAPASITYEARSDLLRHLSRLNIPAIPF